LPHFFRLAVFFAGFAFDAVLAAFFSVFLFFAVLAPFFAFLGFFAALAGVKLDTSKTAISGWGASEDDPEIATAVARRWLAT
jgi:hypothetical protein